MDIIYLDSRHIIVLEGALGTAAFSNFRNTPLKVSADRGFYDDRHGMADTRIRGVFHGLLDRNGEPISHYHPHCGSVGDRPLLGTERHDRCGVVVFTEKGSVHRVPTANVSDCFDS